MKLIYHNKSDYNILNYYNEIDNSIKISLKNNLINRLFCIV